MKAEDLAILLVDGLLNHDSPPDNSDPLDANSGAFVVLAAGTVLHLTTVQDEMFEISIRKRGVWKKVFMEE